MTRSTKRGRPEAVFWSSRTAFVLAATGAVVGFNDFTQFPYLVAHYGGSAFLVVYLFAVIVIGTPLMAVELLVGRLGRADPAAAIAQLAERSGRSRKWGVIGWLFIAGGFMVTTYFSIVAAWTAGYLVRTAAAVFAPLTADGAGRLFSAYVRAPEGQLFWLTVFLLLTMTTVHAGLRRGIERTLPWVALAAGLAFLVLCGYGALLNPSNTAVRGLLAPDFSRMTPLGVVSAFGHAFFGLGLGTGALFAYGAYLPDEVPVIKWSFIIAVADLVIGVLAGIAIYSICFAQGLKPGPGPTLLFEALPIAFDHLPYGTVVGGLFFALLLAVAWMAAIAFIEPAVLWLMRRLRVPRARAVILMGLALWGSGIVGVLSLNVWAFPFHIFGQVKTLGLFDLLSTAAFDVVLPAASLALALFVGWRANQQLIEQSLSALSPCIYESWLWCLRVIAPALLVLVLFNLSRISL
ncbi:MAG: sodium-dependent transporter [Acidiferrobacteraceae bacterium]